MVVDDPMTMLVEAADQEVEVGDYPTVVVDDPMAMLVEAADQEVEGTK